MSNMFDKYTITSEQPCNLNKKHINRSCRKPYEEYDAEGKLVGYYWYYGEAINLQFEVTGEVSVDNDAIIYTALGDGPTTSTLGKVNQKAYNIVENKSWTCTSVIVLREDITYVWVEDSIFEYPNNGGKSIYISANQYLADKKARIEVYNFRYEKMFEQVVEANSIINFNIDLDLSAKLLKGVYYCCVSILSDESVIYLNHLNEDAIILNVK
jgi:hypothetical protein